MKSRLRLGAAWAGLATLALVLPAPVAGAAHPQAVASRATAAKGAHGRAPQPVPTRAAYGVGAIDWLGELNYYRRAAGLAGVADHAALAPGIRDHLRYLAQTPRNYLAGKYQDAHTENPASPYYSAAGARAAATSELFEGAKGYSPRDFIDGWLSAPFHASDILQPRLERVAFAYSAASGDAGLDIVATGRSARPAPAPVLFPGRGAVTNLALYKGDEPNPLDSCPHPAAWADAGLPLVVMLPAPASTSLAAQLHGPGGRDESSANGGLCIVDSHTYKSPGPIGGTSGADILRSDHAVFLIPRRALLPGQYHAVVSEPGRPVISWTFGDDAPVGLAPVYGDGQKAYEGQRFAIPLVVGLRDAKAALGGPLPGMKVTFRVALGTAHFEEGTSTAPAITQLDGDATSPLLVAGPGAGRVTVVATVEGLGGNATFILAVRRPARP
jgi:Cysteine-rich secretory protein family